MTTEPTSPAPAAPRSSGIKQLLGIAAVGLIVAVAYFGGCFGGAVYPDVKLEVRSSMLGVGKVLRVTNAGAKPLFEVAVSAQGWEKAYPITQTLGSGDTAEAGWMELPRGLKTGDTVEIYAKGFSGPRLCIIP